MKTKIVASSFIRRESDGKYLILRRSETDTSRAGQWDLAGGMVDEGEELKTAALREVSEEVGLDDVESCDLLFTVSGVSYSETDKEDCNYIFLYFLIKVTKKNDVVLSFEHDAYDWVDVDELGERVKHRAQKVAYDYIFENKLF